MTDSIKPDNNDDDVSYCFSGAQAALTEAFRKGLLQVRIEDPDGDCLFEPIYLLYLSNGKIEISCSRDGMKLI